MCTVGTTGPDNSFCNCSVQIGRVATVLVGDNLPGGLQINKVFAILRLRHCTSTGTGSTSLVWTGRGTGYVRIVVLERERERERKRV